MRKTEGLETLPKLQLIINIINIQSQDFLTQSTHICSLNSKSGRLTQGHVCSSLGEVGGQGVQTVPSVSIEDVNSQLCVRKNRERNDSRTGFPRSNLCWGQPTCILLDEYYEEMLHSFPCSTETYAKSRHRGSLLPETWDHTSHFSTPSTFKLSNCLQTSTELSV
jgi:hypothetical protein